MSDIRECPYCGEVSRFDPTEIQTKIKPCCKKAKKVMKKAYQSILADIDDG